MTYCSFWIDKGAAPARAGLSITVILITINFNKGVTLILPPASGSIWLVNYFTGILVFSIISMFEYVLLNYCSFIVKQHNEEITKNVNVIKSNIDQLSKHVEKKMKDLANPLTDDSPRKIDRLGQDEMSTSSDGVDKILRGKSERSCVMSEGDKTGRSWKDTHDLIV